MLRALGMSVAMLLLVVPATLGNATTGNADSCRFVLGFATLEALLPIPVGTCLDNETQNPVNGDTLQHTTGGLLVWRKLDNWTAFTDGFHTWVNGPNGLQERLNTQRFAWEANPGGLPVAGALPGHGCGSTAVSGKVRTLCPPS